MRRQTYVIPKNDREIFFDPPINRTLELIHSNKSKFSTYNFNICGIPFQKFRSMARNEILKKAIEYTKQITPTGMQNNSAIPIPQSTIIQTGYQPTFYHPGIWIKNHLAYHIAKRVNGISINISIDNDVCHESWICVPRVDKQEFASGGLEKIEFAEQSDNLAFEELSFSDTNKIINFKDKVLACLNRSASGGSETFEKFSNLMIDASKWTSNSGEILTIARRKFEDFFGIYNLEVPVSKICENDSFLIFFLAILLDCMRFASSYNDRLERYREANKIRSKAHPLPDLKVDGNTIELPFWAWRQGEPRKRLFGQCVENKHINLIYENKTVLTFDTGSPPKADWVDAQLVRLKRINSGIKIRPRAVTITMFSRLFLSDLFIHGIGGARYDVITDSVIKDFFGVEPPDFLTTSATLYLPFQIFNGEDRVRANLVFTHADLNARRLLLRDMHYNPEKYLTSHLKTDKEISMLIMEKQKLIEAAGEQRHEERLHKFKRIREINSFIEGKLLPYMDREKRELERIERLVLYDEIIRNRAYPFCIYPESLLKDFYRQHSLLRGW